jgi:hypothetical protein
MSVREKLPVARDELRVLGSGGRGDDPVRRIRRRIPWQK